MKVIHDILISDTRTPWIGVHAKRVYFGPFAFCMVYRDSEGRIAMMKKSSYDAP